jgi:hypothetical protein
MVPNLTTILPRFTGEWAMLLPPEALLTVCREIGYTAWRDRMRTPVTTRPRCLWQMLHGHTACRPLPHVCQACGAVRRPPVRLVPHSRGAAVTFCSSASAVRYSAPPWTTGGGRAIARVWSMARDGPCPIPWPCRPPSARRRSRSRGAAFPWRAGWACSMPARVCSASGSSRPCCPTSVPGCRRCIRADHQTMGSGPIGACVATPISPCSSRRACTPCGASAPDRSGISRPVGPWPGHVGGGHLPSQACHDPAGAQRVASMTNSWRGGSRRPVPCGSPGRPWRPGQSP